jgi:hypothetical protein
MAILLFWKFERKVPPKLRVCNPPKKREKVLALVQIFAQKKRWGGLYHTQVHFIRTLTIEIGKIKIKIKERESR